MTDANMASHRNSSYISFWNELKPGYDYFQKYHTPPNVVVSSGKYVLTQPVQTTPLGSQLAFTTVK
jgi:murein L,D-transpeptidase YafK